MNKKRKSKVKPKAYTPALTDSEIARLLKGLTPRPKIKKKEK